ncbi:hypothetical protein FRB97_004619, partial [Tulasnella sp. 331]
SQTKAKMVRRFYIDQIIELIDHLDTATRLLLAALALDPMLTLCTYDTPKDITEAPNTIRDRLHARIAELELIVQNQAAQLSACVCRGRNEIRSPTPFPAVAVTSDLPFLTQASSTSAQTIMSSHSLSLPRSPGRNSEHPWENSLLISSNDLQTLPTSPMTENAALSTEIWPFNIPPPELLRHLADTVFHAVPLVN